MAARKRASGDDINSTKPPPSDSNQPKSKPQETISTDPPILQTSGSSRGSRGSGPMTQNRGAILIIGYIYSGSVSAKNAGGTASNAEALSKLEGYLGRHTAKVAELAKFGHPAKLWSSSW
ncbi:unnamed protein product [Ilex paraguariensis]|uniref:Uncharacterized protein n=1 Tax=Ilex paraguariensis TaxID=185542 RepID=A0ABC8SM57_9AQUA